MRISDWISDVCYSDLICQLVSQLSAVCSTIQPAERYSLFPIRDEATYSYFNRHVATVWTNTEMNFHDDREDFDQLPPVQQRMVSLILAISEWRRVGKE